MNTSYRPQSFFVLNPGEEKRVRFCESNPRVRRRRTAWIAQLFEPLDLLKNDCRLDLYLVLSLDQAKESTL